MASNFGRDVSCVSELRSGRYATGARLVAEAVYRRLTTPRGMLRGGEAEQTYGLDLSDLIGSANTAQARLALPGQITAELKKDERIDTVAVNVVDQSDGVGTRFDITIEGVTAEGTFSLVLRVDEVTVEVLGLNAEEG